MSFVIHKFKELESTNSHAMEMARLQQMFHGDVVMAQCQKAGRGRMARSWDSPEGNLYFSIILQPKVGIEKLPEISFLAAVSLRLTLEKLLPESHKKIQNKWPNDLLIDGKKIAGILLESDALSGFTKGFVVLGIGVNLISNPQQTIFPATNLQEFSLKILPEDFLKIFLDEFEILYQKWLDFGFDLIRKIWLQKAWNLGVEVTIKIDGKTQKGIFKDVDLQGNLILEMDGKVQKILVGDVC